MRLTHCPSVTFTSRLLLRFLSQGSANAPFLNPFASLFAATSRQSLRASEFSVRIGQGISFSVGYVPWYYSYKLKLDKRVLRADLQRGLISYNHIEQTLNPTATSVVPYFSFLQVSKSSSLSPGKARCRYLMCPLAPLAPLVPALGCSRRPRPASRHSPQTSCRRSMMIC